ncbi:MAG: leucine-rich repeat protein [Bacteroidaceae bacterium]|nr:leucine-rich repeat protein [Bacteroidaceae bacterium]
MFNIKNLIDKNGVIRIPEYINVGTIENSQGLLYRLVRVGYNTFDELKDLREVQIPATVTNLEWCFYGCSNLSAIYVDEANPELCSIDGVLYTKDCKKLIAYPNAHGKEYKVHDGVEEIAHFAFKSCSSVEIIRLPDSLKKIGNNAFYKCSNLRKVYLPDRIKAIGDATENANIKACFIYRGKEYLFSDLKNKIK